MHKLLGAGFKRRHVASFADAPDNNVVLADSTLKSFGVVDVQKHGCGVAVAVRQRLGGREVGRAYELAVNGSNGATN